MATRKQALEKMDEACGSVLRRVQELLTQRDDRMILNRECYDEIKALFREEIEQDNDFFNTKLNIKPS